MIGLALGCELAPRSIFHRNRTTSTRSAEGVPDLSDDEPLCRGGSLAGVRIHRVHLEEDAAKLIHIGSSGRIHGSQLSVVDFNRGGTPLSRSHRARPALTGPGSRVARTACVRRCARWVSATSTWTRARCGRRERVAAPTREHRARDQDRAEEHELVSLPRAGVAAEIERQRAIIEAGAKVVQETLHFDPGSGAITSLRSKEEAQDYRYFPDRTSCRSRRQTPCSKRHARRCPNCGRPRGTP